LIAPIQTCSCSEASTNSRGWVSLRPSATANMPPNSMISVPRKTNMPMVAASRCCGAVL